MHIHLAHVPSATKVILYWNSLFVHIHKYILLIILPVSRTTSILKVLLRKHSTCFLRCRKLLGVQIARISYEAQGFQRRASGMRQTASKKTNKDCKHSNIIQRYHRIGNSNSRGLDDFEFGRIYYDHQCSVKPFDFAVYREILYRLACLAGVFSAIGGLRISECHYIYDGMFSSKTVDISTWSWWRIISYSQSCSMDNMLYEWLGFARY